MEAMLTAKLSTHNLAFPMLDFGKTEAGGAMPPDANRTQSRTSSETANGSLNAGAQHARTRHHRRANACVLT